ncbi:MAG: tRNA uridine-5-carboxymethylaminomethyl(34) synthesis GTPase MnmE [Clostridia bacterium]|nr:tRNA uridine-5-carboxymethylaminomethyl(34) synthesis GTPase MnmE [Clostridia bacterium]
MLNNTVAAISTARGKGGVAMIRISGDDALSIGIRVVKISTDSPTPRRAYYGSIMRDGAVIDDGILTYFKAPNSFTGEDVCEICCHGGIYVTQSVLESVLSCGAKMAEAGEFTKRAYINGRLTLSRAEAIGNVIDAKTDTQLRLSSSQARGVLSSKISEIREKMLGLIAQAYATVDYPDEDIEDVTIQQMSTTLDSIITELKRLKGSYRAGKAISDGVKTAIIGKPNAGKSSVYNMLLGQELAIVTDIAGTTRDVIESVTSVGGVTLNLADTAGIHDTFDRVEKIGIERAKEKIQDSELLLCVFDFSQSESDEDEFILECAIDRGAIAIINKTDTPRQISEEFEKKILSSFSRVIYASAKNHNGYEELCQAVTDMFELGELDLSNDAIISNARQFASVDLALTDAQEAKELLLQGLTPDVILFSLECALSSLDKIDAREAGEEIVNAIFSRFCVGK